MRDEDAYDLEESDFRRIRRRLAPHVYFWGDHESPERYEPPSDLVSREAWDHIMDLATDVALGTTDELGSAVGRLNEVGSDWIRSWPDEGNAPFIEEACLQVGEDLGALTFFAIHGWYRQALGCLRNALETMSIATAFAVRSDTVGFDAWRAGTREMKLGNARDLIRESTSGGAVERDSSPASIFGSDQSAWMNTLYGRLCAYAHSRPGFNNGDFWQSNGPILVPTALALVEIECRETVALCYLLSRLSWPNYKIGIGQPKLLDEQKLGWEHHEAMLRAWLL
jgi:hypothetical protein